MTIKYEGISIKSEILNQAPVYKKGKRVGRGSGSGVGRTSRRGNEGQRARGSVPLSFQYKDLLKRPKIGRGMQFNKSTNPVFEITRSMIDKDIARRIDEGDASRSLLELLQSEYNLLTIQDLRSYFNIPHYYKKLRIVGFRKNNITKLI